MALTPLSLDVNYGVAGRRFQATISGLSAGQTVEVLNDGTPGFSTVNGRVYSDRLPAQNPVTVVLRVTEPGVGFRDSRFDIAVDGIALGAAGLSAANAALGVKPVLINNLADMIGDSRTADANTSDTTASGLSGVHWFNHANSMNGHRLTLNLNNGYSGARSDQYLLGLSSAGAQVRTGLAGLLASPAAWTIIGYPIVNDLAQSAAGYTDMNGNAVTATTVAAIAAANIQSAVLQLLALGKRVIITPEPGATNLPTAAVRQLYEFNARMRAFAEQTNGVYMWNPLPVLWAPTTSTTAIAMRPNMLRGVDPTHFSVVGGRTAGTVFATFINTLIPYVDFGIASINDNPTTNPRQMAGNPLFTTLTGGTTSSGVVISSGTVPALYEVKGLATSSVAITSAADPNGFGNAVTFAITATAADVVQIIGTAPSVANWNLTDTFQQQVDMDVAAGSVNAWAYGEMQVNTDLGTESYYSMFADGNYAPFPTDAYSYRLRSQAGKVKPGSATKGYLSPRIAVRLTGAGNLTLTLRRPDFQRRF